MGFSYHLKILYQTMRKCKKRLLLKYVTLWVDKVSHELFCFSLNSNFNAFRKQDNTLKDTFLKFFSFLKSISETVILGHTGIRCKSLQ